MTNTDKEIQRYRELSEYAQKQIDRAWKAYAVLAGLIGIAAVMIFGSIGNFKETLRAEYKSEMESAQILLKHEVARAFAAENVQKTVAEVISERMPTVVDNVVSNQIKAIINPTLEQIQEKLSRIDMGNTHQWWDSTNQVMRIRIDEDKK